VSDPFNSRRFRQSAFHGRVSTNRADRKGFENYLNLSAGHYRVRIFLNGEESAAITADSDAGTIEIHNGTQLVTLQGYVEIRLEPQ
jgi:hypothetical protein